MYEAAAEATGRHEGGGGGGVGLGSCLLASSSLTFSLSLTAPPAPYTGYCTMLCPNPNTTPGFVCRFFVFF